MDNMGYSRSWAHGSESYEQRWAVVNMNDYES